MKVLDRWREYRDDESFREIMSDPAMLELSERLFGELPDTREFVRGLRGSCEDGTTVTRPGSAMASKMATEDLTR